MVEKQQVRPIHVPTLSGLLWANWDKGEIAWQLQYSVTRKKQRAQGAMVRVRGFLSNLVDEGKFPRGSHL